MESPGDLKPRSTMWFKTFWFLTDSRMVWQIDKSPIKFQVIYILLAYTSLHPSYRALEDH